MSDLCLVLRDPKIISGFKPKRINKTSRKTWKWHQFFSKFSTVLEKIQGKSKIVLKFYIKQSLKFSKKNFGRI